MTPWATADSDRFRGTMQVSLNAADPEAQIWYTTDPKAPDTHYEKPLTLDRSTDLKFHAVSGSSESPSLAAHFTAIAHGWHVTTASEPNAQYTAGGAAFIFVDEIVAE